MKLKVFIALLVFSAFSCDVNKEDNPNQKSESNENIEPSEPTNKTGKTEPIKGNSSFDVKPPIVNTSTKSAFLEAVKNNPAEAVERFDNQTISDVMASVVYDNDIESLKNIYNGLVGRLLKTAKAGEGVTISLPETQAALIASILSNNNAAFKILQSKYYAPDGEEYKDNMNPVLAAVAVNSPFIDEVLKTYGVAKIDAKDKAFCLAVEKGYKNLYDKLYDSSVKKCGEEDVFGYAIKHGAKDWAEQKYFDDAQKYPSLINVEQLTKYFDWNLVKQLVDKNIASGKYFDVLMSAIDKDNESIAVGLINSGKVKLTPAKNIYSDDKTTPFQKAVKKDPDSKVTKAMVKNLRDSGGNDVQLFKDYCIRSDDSYLCDALIKYGLNVLADPLMIFYAVEHFSINAVKLIVKKDPKQINLKLKTKHGDCEAGDTVLHYPCYQGAINIVKALLDLGADIYAQNNKGETCYSIAQTMAQVGHDHQKKPYREIMDLITERSK